jgi:hypothetical protein
MLDRADGAEPGARHGAFDEACDYGCGRLPSPGAPGSLRLRQIHNARILSQYAFFVYKKSAQYMKAAGSSRVDPKLMHEMRSFIP